MLVVPWILTSENRVKQKQNNTGKGVLDGILGGSNKADSTKTNTTENTVKDVLGNLLGHKKKKQDTIN